MSQGHYPGTLGWQSARLRNRLKILGREVVKALYIENIIRKVSTFLEKRMK